MTVLKIWKRHAGRCPPGRGRSAARSPFVVTGTSRVRLSILSWSLVSVEEMRQTSSLQASFEENIAFAEGS